ncbi:MAG: hypothetical protein H0W62_14825 [Chitinophagales bacterium]|nr:hypothetical protein [Chitinophagales bacterium]
MKYFYNTTKAICILSTTIIFTLLLSRSNAQTHFVPGYVLLNSGDTLKGFINDQQWKINPKKIEFKRSQQEKVTLYSPLTTSSFRITNGDWYISFTGMIDKSSWSTANLSYNAAPDTARDTLFLSAIVVGKASLLYSYDNLQRDHFFIQKDHIIKELYYHKYLNNDGDKAVVKANPVYKGQIIAAFADCKDIGASIMSIPLDYNKKDLERIFQRYNKCKNSGTVYTKQKEKWKFEPSVIAGINYSFLFFKGINIYYNDAKFNDKLGYAFGAGINSVIPRNRGKWSIYTELLVKNYKSTGSGGNLVDNLNMNAVYGKINIMGRLMSPDGKIRPMAELGISNGFAIKMNTNVLPETRKYEQGIVGGIGGRMNKIQLEGRMELTNAMSPYSALKSSFTNLYVLASYVF